ncbi:MAG: class I SAM-dependent methyltransferase, partial [Acidobacteria bacterium]|nr:class I SAM-dependent methyltransferase [Acidobacteriota bacterium]
APQVPAALWAHVAHRATLITAPSPDALPEAVAQAGGLFDFVFVDGDHTHGGVVRDLEGLLGATTAGAHLLCHDSHYGPICAAIDECVARHPGRLVDAGNLSTLTTAPVPRRDGTMALWGGFRLLRVVTPSLT